MWFWVVGGIGGLIALAVAAAEEPERAEERLEREGWRQTEIAALREEERQLQDQRKQVRANKREVTRQLKQLQRFQDESMVRLDSLRLELEGLGWHRLKRRRHVKAEAESLRAHMGSLDERCAQVSLSVERLRDQERGLSRQIHEQRARIEALGG